MTNEIRWVLRAIFLIAFGIGVTLAYVPGAKEVGQSEDFNGALGTVFGIVIVAAMLFGVVRGERAAWLVVIGLVSLRALWDLGVAFDEPTRALGWASAGTWIVVALAAWGLRPPDVFKKRPASSEIESSVER